MSHKFFQLLTLMILIFCIGCKEENEFEENVELKASLQGTWKLASPPSIWTQVTFNDHTATWYDSTVISFDGLVGEIQTERGQCPVKYAFNDGSIGFTFASSTETDVLWFLLNEGENSTIVDYTIENAIVSAGQSWVANQPTGPRHFSTCFVRLSTDRKTVEFCDGGGTISPVDCITYHKEN
jgi:hypothetical protein